MEKKEKGDTVLIKPGVRALIQLMSGKRRSASSHDCKTSAVTIF